MAVSISWDKPARRSATARVSGTRGCQLGCSDVEDVSRRTEPSAAREQEAARELGSFLRQSAR